MKNATFRAAVIKVWVLVERYGSKRSNLTEYLSSGVLGSVIRSNIQLFLKAELSESEWIRIQGCGLWRSRIVLALTQTGVPFILSDPFISIGGGLFV